MEKWNGRVAVVTGASSGIGAEVCRTLVKHGMKVVGAARRVDKIKEIVEELKGQNGVLLPFKCDLTCDEDIYALFKFAKDQCGGVDICINNAGMSFNNSLLDGTPDEWRQMMDVNVISLCLCTKLAVASMRERSVDDGHIININSIGGHLVLPMAQLHFYTGTKYAVRALAEGLRMELREAKSHIRVSSISPGIVETGFFEAMTQNSDSVKTQMLPKELNSTIDMSQILQSKDLADTLVHVISAPGHVEINDVIMRPIVQSF